jgi:hypothetical protein
MNWASSIKKSGKDEEPIGDAEEWLVGMERNQEKKVGLDWKPSV